MFAIEVATVFAASHQLKLPDGALEPLHGHNWQITVCVQSPQLDGMDTVMDFHILEQAVEHVVAPWRNRHLNEVLPFSAGTNPSAERVAQTIAEAVGAQVAAPAKLVWVRVTEAPNCAAIYETQRA